MQSERLVQMLNDICNFFIAEPDREMAINGVVTHIKRYWTPAMREQLIQYFHTDSSNLSKLAYLSVARLAEK